MSAKGKDRRPDESESLAANARNRHESIVKLLHRVLPGAHEVFEIFFRVNRWWGAGHWRARSRLE
jgi:hypothetical protein